MNNNNKKEIRAAQIVENQNSQQHTEDYPIPDDMVTRPKYYTIDRGHTLYHATKTVGQFDRTDINFGQNNDTNSVIWFTPNKDTAELQIAKCQPVYGPNGNILEGGWIHEFIVDISIPNIKLISSEDKDFSWNTNVITNKYCTYDPNNRSAHLNGIGFFRQKAEGDYDIQFALCSATPYLKYVGTYSCVNGNLTEKFDKDRKKSHQVDNYNQPTDIGSFTTNQLANIKQTQPENNETNPEDIQTNQNNETNLEDIQTNQNNETNPEDLQTNQNDGF